MAGPSTFTDLSGSNIRSVAEGENPYEPLLEASSNDPVHLQSLYATHREARNARFRTILLSPSFTGFRIDTTLAALLARPHTRPDPAPGPPATPYISPPTYPGSFDDAPGIDPRYCLTLWARPPAHLRALAAQVQADLTAVLPHSLWLMPQDRLHMTALEMVHSVASEEEVQSYIDQLGGSLEQIVEYPRSMLQKTGLRARLVCPQVVYDDVAIALSYLPAAEEGDGYSYQHLRRDLWNLASGREVEANAGGTEVEIGQKERGISDNGIRIKSRYTVPSAHLTLARFVNQADIAVDEEGGPSVDSGKVEELVQEIERINARLEREIWGKEDGDWAVGHERGLESRGGRCWYGGGERVMLGEGFEWKG